MYVKSIFTKYNVFRMYKLYLLSTNKIFRSYGYLEYVSLTFAILQYIYTSILFL